MVLSFAAFVGGCGIVLVAFEAWDRLFGLPDGIRCPHCGEGMEAGVDSCPEHAAFILRHW